MGTSSKKFGSNNNATKTSQQVVETHEMRANGDIQQLLKDIQRIGDPNKCQCTFGELFDDDEVANRYEALVGTMKTAKKKQMIHYDGQFLLKGVNDDVVIRIL